ncbi:BON domain-containing protein [Chitinibacter bivalviorum]|uniref:BON domain-containing protein n=1 Tax=Chitinibacter bivalviorum TaxID=2739434 RepID=A0A7H9BHA4_9NEIS|nr:BON domain-containing protein [Chitinibacter bivalviorum]QLG88110.1 BON domain-containing protein [Chitinibacter bivalviorum]
MKTTLTALFAALTFTVTLSAWSAIHTASSSAPVPASDMAVNTEVQRTLLSDAELRDFGLRVATRKGDVQLMGEVASQQQMERAITLARSISGVQAIHNHLSVQTANVA